ncbi:MAG: kinase/pyrophosphorylase [bacterium]|nr:kinase/pyrophosphorylase [bacterium]
MDRTETQTIYLVSDGTCRTCEQVVRAVLLNFDGADVRMYRAANVRQAETATDLIRRAAADRAMVFYTMVSAEAREAIEEAARQYMVPVVDLLGPVLLGLSDLLATVPEPKPGILYTTDRAQLDRIDAVEYTLHHDDGRRASELDKADVVLVGVSRTSKSTTCFYLAYSGIRAANVPLVSDSPPPAELLALDPHRVIGLTTNPHRLQTIRDARLRGWGVELTSSYADRVEIARELRAADALMASHGWRCIDVSYRATEETAREVRQLLKDTG